MGKHNAHNVAKRSARAATPDRRGARIVLGAAASGALATAGWAFGSSAPVFALACAAVGGVGSIGDSSCSATGLGAVAIDLFGTNASATGANNHAFAIGPGTVALITGGTNNNATAVGSADTATSALGSNNNTTALGIGILHEHLSLPIAAGTLLLLGGLILVSISWTRIRPDQRPRVGFLRMVDR